MRISIACIFVSAFVSWSCPATAFELDDLWHPFRPPVELVAARIDEARTHGQLDLATSLLEEAEGELGQRPELLRLRGLILRDRGRLAEAVELLRRAADLDVSSEARIEQAATLVTLGRWPDAVDALAQAFEERGGSLRADKVLADVRFAQLVSFEPFQQLVQRVRAEQAGPLGRLVLKFEQIEASLHAAQTVLTTLGRWMSVLGRIAEFFGLGVIALLVLAIMIGMGIHQLGILRPPWPLFVGLGFAACLWHLGAELATAGRENGAATIIIATTIVLLPWGAWSLGRASWRRWRRRRLPGPRLADLDAAVAAAEQYASAGRGLLLAVRAQRPAALARLQEAERRLLDLLAPGALAPADAIAAPRSPAVTPETTTAGTQAITPGIAPDDEQRSA